ncbi:MAG: thioesterase family protein [Pseudomonadota bacterium]
MINNPTYRGTVHPWHCDHMGHMNVMWYVGKFDEATWNFFAEVGLTPAHMKENGTGMAAVEQNLTYSRELFPGDTVTISSRVVEAGEKSVRFVHEMTHTITGELCATCAFKAVHINAAERKSAPFPEDILEKLKSA